MNISRLEITAGVIVLGLALFGFSSGSIDRDLLVGAPKGGGGGGGGGNPPSTTPFFWNSDFEAENLFPSDGTGWNYTQLEPTGVSVAEVSSTTPIASGRALYAYVPPRSGTAVSKAIWEKRLGSAGGEGNTVTVEFDAMLTQVDLFSGDGFITLADIETTSKDGNPGPRLAVEQGVLKIERQKISGKLKDLVSSYSMPINQKVRIRVSLTLSTGNGGLSVIEVDDGAGFREVLRANGQNTGRYTLDRVQLGLTANATDAPIEGYFDNVVMNVQ